jgi:hypothetical protein
MREGWGANGGAGFCEKAGASVENNAAWVIHRTGNPDACWVVEQRAYLQDVDLCESLRKKLRAVT